MNVLLVLFVVLAEPLEWLIQAPSSPNFVACAPELLELAHELSRLFFGVLCALD
ncbi:hypothetical protein SAMN05192541_14628 [Bradyrhizobium arachidis]|nr:hypothetical protein SAMN05192541_14628 [Bradyrhizobium arachidis]